MAIDTLVTVKYRCSNLMCHPGEMSLEELRKFIEDEGVINLADDEGEIISVEVVKLDVDN